MPQPPKKLRKQYLNNQYPNAVLKFEDGHEIVIKRGTGKTLRLLRRREHQAPSPSTTPDARERDLVETRKADDFPDA
jgi:hypothetical protein